MAVRTKDSGDYMRVDLRPGGVDLKSYVMRRAADEGISATKYIQQIIEADMKAHEGKHDRRRDIADMLYRVADEDLPAVETVIKALCR